MIARVIGKGAACVIGILLAAAAPLMNAENSSLTTGIEGSISVSPIRPGPTRPGVADTAPLANETFDVVNDATVVATFTTDAHGKFRVAVAPGRYTVRQRTVKKIGGCKMLSAEVPTTGFAKVDWICDTGMR